MNDVERLAEIAERWKDIKPEAQCESWWWSGIRHVVRNMDSLCDHTSWRWSAEDEVETTQPDVHPDRHDGTVYAHAGEDIHYLLSLLESHV